MRIIHKGCNGLVDFDGSGNWRCRLCNKVGKDKKELIIEEKKK
jgi:hypothetical protein